MEFKINDYKVTNEPLKSKFYTVEDYFYEINGIRTKYVKLATERGNIIKGSEYFIPKKECITRAITKNTSLSDYFENCKEQWMYEYNNSSNNSW